MNKRIILALICLGLIFVTLGILYKNGTSRIYDDIGFNSHIEKPNEKAKKNIVYVEDYEKLKVHTAQGDDWLPAFNAAIKDLSKDGGTVVFSGEYVCSDRLLVINKKNITFLGTPKSKITFLKYAKTPIGIDFVNSENITLKGLTLTSLTEAKGLQFTDVNKSSGTVAPEQSNASIIHLANVNTFKIEDVKIPFHNGFGIVVTKSKKGLIENNTIKNTWRDGIHLQDGNDSIEVRGNNLENTGDDSISVFSSGAEGKNDKIVSKNIQITSNVITNSYNRGIWATGYDIQITNNVIRGTAVGGIYSQSEYWTGVETKLAKKIVIKNNTISSVGTVNSPFNKKADMFRGILIETQNQTNTTRVKNIVIENNKIYSFTNSTTKNIRGIQVIRVRDCVIHANIINDYTYEGITATYSESVTITKNKIYSPQGIEDSRGIHCDNINDLKLVSNEVNGGISTGINTVNSADIELKLNTVYNINPRGLSGKNGIIVSDCSGAEILNNIVDQSNKLENALKLVNTKEPLTVKGNIH